MQKFTLDPTLIDHVQRIVAAYPDVYEIDHNEDVEGPLSYRIRYQEGGNDWSASIYIRRDGCVGWRYKQQEALVNEGVSA
tara:strand:+ start:31477 stop:31716 length:240 start_codon:yes stop_codon:yes gene_type:complete